MPLWCGLRGLRRSRRSVRVTVRAEAACSSCRLLPPGGRLSLPSTYLAAGSQCQSVLAIGRRSVAVGTHDVCTSCEYMCPGTHQDSLLFGLSAASDDPMIDTLCGYPWQMNVLDSCMDASVSNGQLDVPA
ncbi:hypothetical protein BV20DRAFT_578733 [Pilatotrama ljubarskyi]|nr:hypothetical protein BV20DRAFT_578733 [Pilatotrama ljubarskyi]